MVLISCFSIDKSIGLLSINFPFNSSIFARLRMVLTKSNKEDKARVVSDYIAGMTDRFAIREHQKFFDVTKGWY